MKKVDRANLIISEIKESGHEFKVLNTVKGVESHIRVTVGNDVFDVWPNTGTYLYKGEHVRNNVQGLLEMINGGNHIKSLRERVTELEAFCAHLEYEISRIKERI
jgi:hypothetical protein